MIIRQYINENLAEYRGLIQYAKNISNQIYQKLIDIIKQIHLKYFNSLETKNSIDLQRCPYLIINQLQAAKFKYLGESNELDRNIKQFQSQNPYPNIGTTIFIESENQAEIHLNPEFPKKFGLVSLDNEILFDFTQNVVRSWSREVTISKENLATLERIIYSIESDLTHEFKHLSDYIKSKGNIFQTKKTKRYEFLRNLPDSLQTDEISKEIELLYRMIPSENLARFAEFIGGLDWISYENNFKRLFEKFKREYSDLEFMDSKERKRIIGMLYSLWSESHPD